MEKRNLIIISLLFAIMQIHAQSSYHITNGVEFDKSDCPNLSKLIVILPYAQTNQYQIVNNVNINSGELLSIPGTDDKYLRYSLSQSDIQNLENNFQISYEFDITLQSFNFDFNQITELYPYDTTSNVYLWYSGASGEYVVPENLTIQTIGDSLWLHSSNIVDYAEKCYEYVASHYNYLNPNTGLHTLSDIISAGGGDCGNLSSIYVSLIRHKKIPARHIVTIRPDGSYHVWADFYLEYYGWIPVDVTYKQSNPSGNYFGNYDGNGIVMSKEVWMQIERQANDTYYTSLLQAYDWWYWENGECDQFTSQHFINSNIISTIQPFNSIKFNIYPNSTSGIVHIESDDKIQNLILFDLLGRQLLIKTDLQQKEQIDLSDFESGIYLISLKIDDKTYTGKIIKE